MIPIESAEAIANLGHVYESFDLPKGTLQGSPPIPEDDMTTLRVAYYLVANKKLKDGVVSELAKVVMETRRDLLGEFPVLAQIGTPSTDKDAFLPIHPGAAAYFDGTEQDFFDQYGNVLSYGPMLLGALASVLAAAWKFMGLDVKEKVESPLDQLYALAGRIRLARSEADLDLIEEDIDSILQHELTRYSKGDFQAGDAAALSLAARRLEHLVNFRRSTFARSDAVSAAD
ncbi:TAXI family TRAP transporter solute-binding subunit [Bradyrhizobium sp. sGM-13]|uniref:TAXI family TRAP transporter solute-binding subunit n=1 Tax=Bradyrhizobium sp. sGM-13 TaxID=2831781 RepID=UPI001BCE7041|nr:TAXI family TRAP transporter solute-binding subunit [Bradyrhizobium sp. sGM-13]